MLEGLILLGRISEAQEQESRRKPKRKSHQEVAHPRILGEKRKSFFFKKSIS